ncbi:hypothetical protein BV898_11958 [Hypsibius exemplaris]|uniref:Uncharacterized protein n=1 Tax=Hypsibius exemplaris TaxID=2072580 RepID=A0A1W0WF73_HYPEX|nr:hypothetical protein BV898_11958 [Hypsibius exemplaris]
MTRKFDIFHGERSSLLQLRTLKWIFLVATMLILAVTLRESRSSEIREPRKRPSTRLQVEREDVPDGNGSPQLRKGRGESPRTPTDDQSQFCFFRAAKIHSATEWREKVVSDSDTQTRHRLHQPPSKTTGKLIGDPLD